MIPRYARPEMTQLWTSEKRLELWRDVELYALEGLVEQGLAPGDALASCVSKAGSFNAADVAAIDEIEKTTKHDVIAFLTFMERRIGPDARWLHLGMTSSDVLDTSLAVQLKLAGELLLSGLDRCKKAVEKRALEHKRTPMIGRSHGIHAEPITFGLKMATWYDELSRAEARLRAAISRVAVGKISGAVGTFAHLPPAVEAHVCRRLGLTGGEPAATQIVQRDRHAEFFNVLALVGASIEKFATEIRHLQRTEVREAEEPFTVGQKGSSAMPHKRNPVLSENLTGLARLLRGYALSAMEDVALWHERDISHSSVERIIGPDATVTLDFMLHRFAKLVEDLRVYPERMKENLEAYGGLVHSQRLLLELARKGLDRQAAYVVVQRNAMKVWEQNQNFREALRGDAELAKLMTPAEIDACLDLEHHFRHVDDIFVRVFGRSK
ncbi:MAG: adenylosuccinate lyase [Deltaproteobacteria bacterium]|nr:adenylosuccinate lyase [Deltaproteobacteria bacterium]